MQCGLFFFLIILRRHAQESTPCDVTSRHSSRPIIQRAQGVKTLCKGLWDNSLALDSRDSRDSSPGLPGGNKNLQEHTYFILDYRRMCSKLKDFRFRSSLLGHSLRRSWLQPAADVRDIPLRPRKTYGS